MESRKIAGDYHVLELIGEGSFGKVHRGRRICTGEVFHVFLSSLLLHLSNMKSVTVEGIIRH